MPKPKRLRPVIRLRHPARVAVPRSELPETAQELHAALLKHQRNPERWVKAFLRRAPRIRGLVRRGGKSEDRGLTLLYAAFRAWRDWPGDQKYRAHSLLALEARVRGPFLMTTLEQGNRHLLEVVLLATLGARDCTDPDAAHTAARLLAKLEAGAADDVPLEDFANWSLKTLSGRSEAEDDDDPLVTPAIKSWARRRQNIPRTRSKPVRPAQTAVPPPIMASSSRHGARGVGSPARGTPRGMAADARVTRDAWRKWISDHKANAVMTFGEGDATLDVMTAHRLMRETLNRVQRHAHNRNWNLRPPHERLIAFGFRETPLTGTHWHLVVVAPTEELRGAIHHAKVVWRKLRHKGHCYVDVLDSVKAYVDYVTKRWSEDADGENIFVYGPGDTPAPARRARTGRRGPPPPMRE